MIPRYARPQASHIWSNDFKYQTWFKIESAAATACAKIGMIPLESAQAIEEKGKIRLSLKALIEKPATEQVS